MPKSFKRVKKQNLVKYLKDPGLASRFREVQRFAGYKRLLSIFQSLERKGYSKKDAMDLIEKQGASFVEDGLKLKGLPLDLAIEAFRFFGEKDLKRARALAKKKGRPLSRIVRLAIRQHKAIEKQPQRGLYKRVRTWYSFIEKETHSRVTKMVRFIPKQADYLAIGKPFIEHFEKTKIGKLTLELGFGFIEAPLNINVLENGNLLGVTGLLFGKEGKRKIVTIPVLQGIKGVVNREWAVASIKSIEEFARTHGFAEIRLLKPENNPWLIGSKNPRAKAFYYTIARKAGLRKSGDFLLKKLD